MKATGIVRRIDDLGRVVIPKEIRRTLRIREGDPLEIYTDNNGEVIFKKYSPIGELGTFATQYADVLYKTGGLAAVICDRDHVIAVSGIPKKELLERRVAHQLEELMDQRRSYAYTGSDNRKLVPVEGIDKVAIVASPIVAAGDVVGSILYLAGEGGNFATESESKLVAAAAAFLGKQMEE